MIMVQNLLLDFSHIYPMHIENDDNHLIRNNLSDIEGTNMYCSNEDMLEIQRRLNNYGPEGIHFLDNGNYHYMTKVFVDKIKKPFSLVLFDHHTDMLQPMIHDLTSCGSWAGELLHENAYLKQLILIGPSQQNIESNDVASKVIYISVNEQEEDVAHLQIKKVDLTLPAYISIDKDVLDRYWARTNWDQGNMSIKTLEKILQDIFKHQNVIGVDICGECDLHESYWQLKEDEKINHMTNDILYHFLSQYML